jgi:hypothetical protein
MLRSDSITKVTTAQAKARAEIPNIEKDSVNPHFKSRYADLATINRAVMPVLASHGLVVMQPTRIDGNATIVETYLIHAESGEYIGSEYPAISDKNNPQSLGSAITYARRYSLCSLLGLVADEDDDANAASPPPRANPPAPAARPAKPNEEPPAEWAKYLPWAAKKMNTPVAVLEQDLFGFCVAQKWTTDELPDKDWTDMFASVWSNPNNRAAIRAEAGRLARRAA